MLAGAHLMLAVIFPGLNKDFEGMSNDLTRHEQCSGNGLSC